MILCYLLQCLYTLGILKMKIATSLKMEVDNYKDQEEIYDRIIHNMNDADIALVSGMKSD